MRILFIGDIVGRPGRDLVRRGLGALVESHRADLVIANVENAAAGFGITRDIGDELLEIGIDVMTSGNHIWDATILVLERKVEQIRHGSLVQKTDCAGEPARMANSSTP